MFVYTLGLEILLIFLCMFFLIIALFFFEQINGIHAVIIFFITFKIFFIKTSREEKVDIHLRTNYYGKAMLSYGKK